MNLKMNNKFLVLLVLCVASASCVELENLCSSDRFNHNGVEVNAFHKSRQNITFESLSHFLIDHAVVCDPSEFRNKTNYFETLKLKNLYNRKFVEFWADDLNGATTEQLEDRRLTIYRSVWKPLLEMRIVEPDARCVDNFMEKSYSGYSVLTTLQRFTYWNGYPDEEGFNSPFVYFKPTISELIKNLEELFEKLNSAVDAQFALKSKTAYKVYYTLGFVLPREFKFLSSSGSDKKSMLTYEQFMPFHNEHVRNDEGCVPVKELPRFYKAKGKGV